MATFVQNEFRNSDGGFGSYRGKPSSIVNTAEALYVLSLEPRRYQQVIVDSTAYLRETLALYFDDPKRSGVLRYYVYGLFGLLTAGVHERDNVVQACAARLIDLYDHTQFGWAHEKGQKVSLSSTFLALWALQLFTDPARQGQDLIERSLGELQSRQRENGDWCNAEVDDVPSRVLHTAMSLTVLGRSRFRDNDVVERGRKYLRKMLSHEPKLVEMLYEQIPGRDWQHFTYQWIAVAFQQPPSFDMLALVVRHIKELRGIQPGQWRDRPGTMAVINVTSTFAVCYSLAQISASFDPFIHVESQQENLQIQLLKKENQRLKDGSDLATGQRERRVFVFWWITVPVILLIGAGVYAAGFISRSLSLDKMMTTLALTSWSLTGWIALIRKFARYNDKISQWGTATEFLRIAAWMLGIVATILSGAFASVLGGLWRKS